MSDHTKKTYNISDINKKNSHEIITDKYFFWLAFCKILRMRSLKFNPYPDRISVVSETDDKLLISGIRGIIASIESFIEEVRVCFANGSKDKRSFVILPIEVHKHYVIKEKTRIIEVTHTLNGIKYPLFNEDYKIFILPVMNDFCASLGAECSPVIFPAQKVIYSEIQQIKKERGFWIDWVKDSATSEIPAYSTKV